MDRAKKARLEAAGFAVGGAAEFLGLTPAERGLVEARLALSVRLKERRLAAGLSQSALAGRLGSSQSRVARIEAADPSVSLDLITRAFFETGATIHDMAEALAEAGADGTLPAAAPFWRKTSEGRPR